MNLSQPGSYSTGLSEPTDSLERHTSPSQGQSSNRHLDVPRPPNPRRHSLESTFSEFSELSDLSFLSNDLHAHALTRKLSNASDGTEVSAYSQSGRRSRRRMLYDWYDENYGALLVLLSQAFGVGMNISTRLLEQPGPHGEPMHPFQILFTRQSLTALLCATYALTTKSIPYYPLGPPDRNVRLLLVARGVTGFFGVFGMYFSLLYLPLSEATVLTFLCPILTCYLCSYVIPGETFSRQQQIAGFVSLLGVIFIAQPASLLGFSTSSVPTGGVSGTPDPPPTAHGSAVPDVAEVTPSQRLLAVGIAMIGVLGATGALTSIRAIGTRAHAFISINYFSVWSSFVCLVALMVLPSVSFRLPGNWIEWALLLFLGTCGFVMQGLLTMGLAYKSTGRGGGSGQPKVGGRKVKKESTPEDIEMQSALPSSSDAQPAQVRQGSAQRGRRSGRSNAQPKTASSSGTKATSMVYTQMLFALAGDRIVFGVTPGLWSWIGSGLILAGAIWVASAKDGPKDGSSKTKNAHSESERRGDLADEVAVGSRGANKATDTSRADTHERVGLLDEIADVEEDENEHDAFHNDHHNTTSSSSAINLEDEEVSLLAKSSENDSRAI